jgi:hypothetical protein
VAWRKRDGLGIAMALSLVLLLSMNASYADWWGAAGWGPRRLMEGLPFATLLSFKALDWRGSQGLQLPRILAVTVALGIAVQGVGFFLYDSSWDFENEPTQSLSEVEGELRYKPKAEAEAVLWRLRGGVLDDALAGLRNSDDPLRGLQFGLDSPYMITSHRPDIRPVDMPSCSKLRQVDRFPRIPQGPDPG